MGPSTRFVQEGCIVKRIALALGLCLLLLAGCAPRAREYPVATTGQATRPPAAGDAWITLDDPSVRFAVPEGWYESADANRTVHTLKGPEGDLTIEFYALPRLHPDRTQKQEHSALKNTVRRLYSDVKFDYEDPAWVVNGKRGIECRFTGVPAASGADRESVHMVVIFAGGYEYAFTLTAPAGGSAAGERALSAVLLSLEIG
jgi:hypothetical protein